MPRQKFCSVPGCLSTTELIKREQESFLSAFCERCSIGRPCRCPAPDIYTTRKETRTKFTSWCSAIGLKDPGYYINVCYKHFSTGCPSRSCPNPDVVIPVWEKHVRDRINNVLKPPLFLKKKKGTDHQISSQVTGVPHTPLNIQQRRRKKTKTFLVSLDTNGNTRSLHSALDIRKVLQIEKECSSSLYLSAPPPPPSPAPPLPNSPIFEESSISLLSPELSSSHSSTSSSSTSSSLPRHPSFEGDDDHASHFLFSSSSSPIEEALLDQSEDPCLNDGNILRSLGGVSTSSSSSYFPSFPSSSSNSSSFGDEFESVQKWLEVCE